MTYNDFINYVNFMYHNNNTIGMRYGQMIMNYLSEVWPDKHRELISTYDDCFYDDQMVSRTLSRLEREWVVQNG